MYRYKRRLACINRLGDKLTETQSRIESIGSRQITDMPRGGSGSISLENLIDNKQAIVDRIVSATNRAHQIRREMAEKMDKFDDVRYSNAILRKEIRITCKGVVSVGDTLWVKCPSGYICGSPPAVTYIIW